MLKKHDQKLELIRTLPPFEGATEKEIRALGASADVVTADAGRVICRADRRALEAYVIVDGMVDVVLDGTVLATLRRGQIVGELGVLDGQPRSADVIAATDVTALAIPAQEMRALFETSHAMRTAVLRQLADRVRTADLELAAS